MGALGSSEEPFNSRDEAEVIRLAGKCRSLQGHSIVFCYVNMDLTNLVSSAVAIF